MVYQSILFCSFELFSVLMRYKFFIACVTSSSYGMSTFTVINTSNLLEGGGGGVFRMLYAGGVTLTPDHVGYLYHCFFFLYRS